MNYNQTCEDCNNIHDLDLKYYCPYHNKCFIEEHKLCRDCYECMIYKDGNNYKNTCFDCINKKSKKEEFVIVNIECKYCNKEHDSNKNQYCFIENECFIYKHTYCEIDGQCRSELDIHCLECNKCHNSIQTEYCFGCNYCYDYKHKLCQKCYKCLSISGKKNTDKIICDDCEYNIKDNNAIYDSILSNKNNDTKFIKEYIIKSAIYDSILSKSNKNIKKCDKCNDYGKCRKCNYYYLCNLCNNIHKSTRKYKYCNINKHCLKE